MKECDFLSLWAGHVLCLYAHRTLTWTVKVGPQYAVSSMCHTQCAESSFFCIYLVIWMLNPLDLVLLFSKPVGLIFYSMSFIVCLKRYIALYMCFHKLFSHNTVGETLVFFLVFRNKSMRLSINLTNPYSKSNCEFKYQGVNVFSILYLYSYIHSYTSMVR